ncbi:MAG: 50S ribosomal protein L5 [Micavibrio sp.]|nr:50S ribosomal protein L5 [Micavibrio sp.]HCK31996.1 50S ribosomal protein L5 [Rhodospirillaceae bacterium]|tara:strand:- start:80 stop:643 length:564 start_codon:yes stop_codon:yes gene_type:complete
MSANKKEYTPRLEAFYQETLRKQLIEKLGCKNELEVPKLDKIVLNMGVGDAVADRKHIEHAVAELTAIAGQKAVPTYAKKSIATFKVRDGMALGCKVTLRREKMYEFMDRLVNIALPRVRDFRGISAKAFDGNGNYSLGIKEHIVFPEIDYDKVANIRGLDVVICTTAKTDDAAKELLDGFSMPFKK